MRKKFGLWLIPVIALCLITMDSRKAESASDTFIEQWGDLVLDSTYESMKRADVKKVSFPHWFHRIRYKCKACHDTLFKMEKGSSKINMSGIIRGQYCGKCHDGTIAFSAYTCERCHNHTEKSWTEVLAMQKEKERLRLEAVAMKEEEDEGDEEEAGDDEEFSDEEEEEEDEGPPSIYHHKAEIDPNSSIFLNKNGLKSSTGSPKEKVSLAAKIGTQNRPPALEGLTSDKFGLVDWVAIMKERKINPLPGISLEHNKDRFEDWVQVFIAKSSFVDDVVFPHDIHTFLIDCDSCHPKPFISKEGKNPGVKMSELAEGKWCGKCHGKVAFPLADCRRCHTKPKEHLAKRKEK